MTPAGRERLQVRMPLLAVCGAAWVLLLAQRHEMGGAAVCSMPSMPFTGSQAASLTAGSALMFAAMMAPLLGAPVRHVRDRSFVRRRLRGILLFVGGYASLWTVAGVVLLMAAAWIVSAGSPVMVSAAVIAVAAWQFSPAKQRCLNRCHSHSGLSAFGAAADLDVLRFGLEHGLWCIGSCAGLMLLPLLFSRGHIAAMAGVTLWLSSERLEKPMPPRWRWRGPTKAVRIAVAQARLWLQRS
jgi:predicted metal-binding membrane protein